MTLDKDDIRAIAKAVAQELLDRTAVNVEQTDPERFKDAIYRGVYLKDPSIIQDYVNKHGIPR